MALSAGTRLGNFEILAPLGSGGMGEVYRARDTKLGREVAIKVLPEAVSQDPEKLARFGREAHLLASLNHPNIATIHGLEESDGQQFLVMELVEGDTLADRLRQGPMPVDEALPLFERIAEGLEAAHEKGIVHRDLKPANIKITQEGKPKILDFGLAKAMAGDAVVQDLSQSPTLTRNATETGVLLGTAPYMSPEQARGKVVDKRTDIWAFGCCLYEALTGKAAFLGETVSDTIGKILEREPDWQAVPAGVPVSTRNVLRRCLQKDAAHRLHDIADARIEIDEAVPEPLIPTVARSPRRYLPWAIAALASIIAVWSPLRPREEAERRVSRLTVNLPPEQGLGWINDPSVAISPDGERLAFVGGGTARGNSQDRRLYIRPLDQLEARPVPGTEGLSTAAFSPDGEWVVFYVRLELKKVRLDTGMTVTLCDLENPWGASWGPDDTIFFSPSGTSGLSKVSALGGTPSVVTTLDATKGETSHRWPEALPDGKSVLFTILTESGDPRVGLLSLETGKYKVLLDNGFSARYAPPGRLVYASGGAFFAVSFDLDRQEVTGEPVQVLKGVRMQPAYGTAHFALSRNGTLAYVPDAPEERALVWVDRAGSVRPVTISHHLFEDPRLSPDGQRISLAILDDARLHVWVYDIARDNFDRLTFGPEPDQAPIWTPAGNRLTFRRGDTSNLFWIPADGSGHEERLTTSPYLQRATSWSPDGKVLVYMERQPSQDDLWLLHLDGAQKPRPFLETPFQERFGVISPDGHFIAYASNESGRMEIYVRPFPGPGGKWHISSEGGVQPVWAHSGREIFYRNGSKMMTVAVVTQPAFRAAKPTVLFEGEFHLPESAFPQYDVTADGEHFVMIQDLNNAPTEIQVVQNFDEELKRLVPTGK